MLRYCELEQVAHSSRAFRTDRPRPGTFSMRGHTPPNSEASSLLDMQLARYQTQPNPVDMSPLVLREFGRIG